MTRTSAILALLLTACATAEPPPPSASPTLFENVRIIVGDGSVIEDGAMLVEDGTITAVAPLAAITVPNTVEHVDLGGRTVMPAMIDGHVHLGFEGHSSWGAENYTRENVVEHLERLAYYGFGAAFTTGTDPAELMHAIRIDQDAGQVGGARILFAAGMAPPGAGPNPQMLEAVNALGGPIVHDAATAEEARAAVREISRQRIPFIKIWVDDRGGAQQKMTPDVFAAIIDEAHRHNIPVVAHQQTSADTRALLDAGVDGFLHGRLGPDLDDELAARLASSGAFLVPNLGLGERGRDRVFEDPFLTETLAPEVVRRLAQSYTPRPASAPERERELREAMRRLIENEVAVLLGTDAGAVPDHFFGYSGHRELEIYTRLGMTPMQAIVAATSTPARHLGLADMGTIAAGKRADFIVLDSDPLEDIRNTRSIVDVYLRGQRLDRDGMRERFQGR